MLRILPVIAVCGGILFGSETAFTEDHPSQDEIFNTGTVWDVYLHPTSNKFMFIPWDQDQSFGQFPRGSQEQRERLSIHKPWNGGNEFLEKMFQVEAFKGRYLAALKEVNESIIQNDRIDRRVAQLAERLRGPVGEESVDRLAELDNAAAGRMMTTLMTGRGNRMIETKPIRMFVPLRQASIADQLAGRSEGETTDRGSRFGR